MTRPAWAPEPIDIDQPSAARIYDYLLGGAHNFAADRAFAARMLEIYPEAPQEALSNRGFLRRAVEYCVDAGIRQFLDLGSGIPTVGNVHEVAQRAARKINATPKVVYVDLDPVAVTHSESLLADEPNVTALLADMRDPEAVLEGAAELLDLSEPVALLMVGVLHFVSDDDDPAGIIRGYAKRLVPGSHLVISHMTSDTNPLMARRLVQLSKALSMSGTFRTRDEIRALFGGFTLIEPGLVPVAMWRPDSPFDPRNDPESSWLYAGVGRKEEPDQSAAESEAARR